MACHKKTTQDFVPPQGICEHLNAFHMYAKDPKRFVETNHYCTHFTKDFRQCILYDSPNPGARLIGIEYMCLPSVFETFPEEEKKLWHSHLFEVKSGMLILPKPECFTEEEWTVKETEAMNEVRTLYGKTYHLWQVDRGDKYPFGEPELMMSITDREQMDFDKLVGARDKKFGIDYRNKEKAREHLEDFKIDPVVDIWRKK